MITKEERERWAKLCEADAVFIAESRSALPRLLAEVERLGQDFATRDQQLTEARRARYDAKASDLLSEVVKATNTIATLKAEVQAARSAALEEAAKLVENMGDCAACDLADEIRALVAAPTKETT